MRAFGQCHGYAPNLREIGKAAGTATPCSVSNQLAVLRPTGYLRRGAKRPRSVEVRLPGQPTVRLEVNDLAEALDIHAQDSVYVPVPCLARSPRVRLTCQAAHPRHPRAAQAARRRLTPFPLRVHGDSMTNGTITDGNVVAATIDGEARVKTLRRSPDQVWLMPHNPMHTPIPAYDATILGKVGTVLRRI